MEIAMGRYQTQYEHLWESLHAREDAYDAAVGGDFESVGKLEFAL